MKPRAGVFAALLMLFWGGAAGAVERPLLDFSFNGEPEGYAVAGPVKTLDHYGIPDQAYLFDGENDFIDLPNISTSAYTVAVWVLIGPGNTGPDQIRIVDGWSDGEVLGISYQEAWQADLLPEEFIGYQGVGDYLVGSFHPWVDETTIYNERHLCFPVDLRDGAWHHLAISFDGETGRLYLDGEEVLSCTFGPHVPSDAVDYTEADILAVTDLSLGRFKRLGTYFSGSLDLFKYWAEALSPREVAELALQ